MATCGVRQSRSFTDWNRGDFWDALVLCGWRLYSGTWNPVTYPWMKPLTFLRIVHCGDWCLYVYCYTLLMMKWWRWWLFAVERLIIVWFLSPYQIEWCRFIFVYNTERNLNYILYLWQCWMFERFQNNYYILRLALFERKNSTTGSCCRCLWRKVRWSPRC